MELEADVNDLGLKVAEYERANSNQSQENAELRAELAGLKISLATLQNERDRAARHTTQLQGGEERFNQLEVMMRQQANQQAAERQLLMQLLQQQQQVLQNQGVQRNLMVAMVADEIDCPRIPWLQPKSKPKGMFKKAMNYFSR